MHEYCSVYIEICVIICSINCNRYPLKTSLISYRHDLAIELNQAILRHVKITLWQLLTDH